MLFHRFGKMRLTFSILRRVLDLIAGLLLIGVGQGLLLASLLVFRNDLRNPSTLFLAGLIGAVTFTGLEDAALRFGWFENETLWAGLSLFLLPLIGPLLKGHCEAVLDARWRLEGRHRWQVATFILGWILAAAFFTAPGQIRVDVLTDRANSQDSQSVAAALILFAAYVLAAISIANALLGALRLLKNVQTTRQLGEALASRLVWLRGLLGLGTISWCAYIVSLIGGIVPNSPAKTIEAVSSVVQVGCLYGIGVLALVKPDRIFPAPGQLVSEILAPATQKYGRAALSEAELDRLASAILVAMNRDRLYRDPLLSLSRLAASVGASPNDVSQTLNTRFGFGYHEFIGTQRLLEAREILRDPTRKESLAQIMLDVGFNSKSAFNAAFKKQFGITPSELRRLYATEHSSSGGLE